MLSFLLRVCLSVCRTCDAAYTAMRNLAKSIEKHQSLDAVSEEQQTLQNMLFNDKEQEEDQTGAGAYISLLRRQLYFIAYTDINMPVGSFTLPSLVPLFDRVEVTHQEQCGCIRAANHGQQTSFCLHFFFVFLWTKKNI